MEDGDAKTGNVYSRSIVQGVNNVHHGCYFMAYMTVK